jgi:uncharacterized protein
MATHQIIDLGRLALSPGEGRRIDVELDPGPLELAGQDYAFVGRTVGGRLDLSRTAAGHAMRLAFAGELGGPCMRCLEPAEITVEVEAREVDQAGAADEDLISPYVSEGMLDIGAWAHDAVALALPAKLLCRPDCAGLCAGCGASLNDADPAEHEHGAARDPRWAKLDELR